MTSLLWNIVLALLWAAVTGSFSLMNLLTGFVLGLIILFFMRRAVGSPRYPAKVVQVLGLIVFFVWELIKSNVRLAYDVLTPGLKIRPGVVGIPLDAKTDAEITLLANLITLTPGTLSLDVSADRSTLFIHAMYIDDADAVRREIKNGFERRVLEVLR